MLSLKEAFECPFWENATFQLSEFSSPSIQSKERSSGVG